MTLLSEFKDASFVEADIRQIHGIPDNERKELKEDTENYKDEKKKKDDIDDNQSTMYYSYEHIPLLVICSLFGVEFIYI